MECRLVNMVSGIGETYSIGLGLTEIGRDSDNHVQIMSEGVSRHHAAVNNMPNVCEIEDMESTNGSFVNGERITRTRLHHGDEIRFGDFIFRFEEMGAGVLTTGDSQRRDYSDRTRNDTIRITKRPKGDDLSGKTRTSAMRPVSPLKPKSE